MPSKRGRDAAARWLASLGLEAPTRWHVEIAVVGDDARFDLVIYAEEWGFAFRQGGQASWIRVVEAPAVHGRDDFGLLALTPELATIDTLIAQLEQRFRIRFARERAIVRTNVAGEDVVRAWLMSHL